jgi:hypothetical protein
MMRLLAGVALLMLCSACPSRTLSPTRPDLSHPERLVCEAQEGRPTLPPEYVIDWSRVVTVEQARTEHDAYVRSVRSREGVIVGYVVSIESKLFVCSNNAEWWRDYWSGLDRM